MKLLTPEIRERLEANGAEPGADHRPAVKFFNPAGAGTWLITEISPDDGDTLFGLCDLGMGFPELGCVSIAELKSVRVFGGLGIERDLYFEAAWPISVYARAARWAGRITEDVDVLGRAEVALAEERRREGKGS